MRSPEEIKAEIAELERLKKKRENKPGFSANVAEIDKRLEAARAELADG
jgi:hypothetical protein